ncbi:Uu.00g094770.m01.CDS01 [Anthostomella pinea]|uniref:Uu.00g094770.m01.CDS01 n=1 Tax=Anthostomella pinea TaxID=933095 RepID=A0AAI8VPN2_9PEZI|nr:Uu.00g094770.m01.CDS01 [Anthostomella pinea]
METTTITFHVLGERAAASGGGGGGDHHDGHVNNLPTGAVVVIVLAFAWLLFFFGTLLGEIVVECMRKHHNGGPFRPGRILIGTLRTVTFADPCARLLRKAGLSCPCSCFPEQKKRSVYNEAEEGQYAMMVQRHRSVLAGQHVDDNNAAHGGITPRIGGWNGDEDEMPPPPPYGHSDTASRVIGPDDVTPASAVQREGLPPLPPPPPYQAPSPKVDTN